MVKIEWKENGWNSLPEQNAELKIKSVDCKTENGKVVEVVRLYEDGKKEEIKVYLNDKPALPMDCKSFEEAYGRYELDFRA